MIESGTRDEEHLHLRHQPRQHAERQLNTRPNTRNGAESWMPTRNASAIVRVTSAATSETIGTSPGPEQLVAVVQAGDHQVMQVGREDQRDAEQGEEIADDQALLALRRIDRGDEAEAELLGDHRARDLQRRDGQPRGQAEHHADQQFLPERDEHRSGRCADRWCSRRDAAETAPA